MRYQFILWDFDGTLADTLASLLQLYNQLAVRHGLRPVVDPEAARGLTPRAFLKRHHIPLRVVPTLVREVRKAHRERMADTRLFPGLAPVLEALQGAGCRLAILSSNAAENIRVCLRANRVEGRFEFVIGYSRLLGKGRAIRHLLKKLGLDPGVVVYVGDEVRDVEAARQAGVASAAVTWGFNSRDLLAAHGPDFLIEHPEELRQWLLTA